MAIIKEYQKKTGTTYVFESISVWDKEKKQSRAKRRLIGKIDPKTGEIVPTGKRGRKPKMKPAMVNEEYVTSLQAELEQEKKKSFLLELRLEDLERKNELLSEENGLLKEQNAEFERILKPALSQMQTALKKWLKPVSPRKMLGTPYEILSQTDFLPDPIPSSRHDDDKAGQKSAALKEEQATGEEQDIPSDSSDHPQMAEIPEEKQ